MSDKQTIRQSLKGGSTESMKKNSLRKVSILIVTLLLVMSMTACSTQGSGSDSSSDSSVEYVIRLGLSDTEDNLIAVSLKNYSDWVNEQTNGRVLIRLYTDEELGDNTEMAQQLVTGELDAMMMPQGVEATYAPKIATLGLPFLFTSYEQAWAVMDDEEVAEGLTQGLEDYNMIQLAFWENGMRQLTNNSKEINSPEDVEGLKIRIPDDAMTAAIFKELGAATTKFAWSKTYDALKEGIFDGQENPIANIYSSKINEVNQYITITNHKYESKNLVFSLTTWKKLPSDIQEILLEGAKTYGQEHREAVASAETEQLAELKKAGMIATEEPDIDAFKVATRSVYTDFELQNEWTADLVARIRQIVATVK